MKILYLHQYFATPNSNAGTRSFEMARRLVSKGHDVEFVTSSAYLTGEYNFNKGWNFIEIEGIKLNVLHLPYSNNDSFFKRLIKFASFSFKATFKCLSLNADVVFATSTPLTIAIPAIIFKRIKRKPMVFEVRDLWPELPVAVGALKSPLLIYLARKLEKITYANSSRLVALSPGMSRGIEKCGVEKKLITLATNSCDTDLFDVSSSIGKAYKSSKLAFVGTRKLAVYTGTFGVINKVEFLVDLALSLKKVDSSICLVAIGDGMEKSMVVEKAKVAGVLNENLFVLPAVPKTEIVKVLSAADLAFSLFGPVEEMWHNSANKLFDALASGTPVAINYFGWQKDLIEESKCGVVLNPENSQEAAKNLSLFLNDEQRYSYAKVQCNQLAYKRFSRDIMAERLEKAILEAVND